MKTKFFPLLFVATFAAAIAAPSQDVNSPAPRAFPHPDRIRYDGQCLTIDGKDMFIYSGSFHYFRCPKALWADRFKAIKDAGFNAVETYVPWNYSERQMPSGLNDFSRVDLKDLDDWLTMAERFGFYVIVRPGPYICAEWATGGFPQWLLTLKPAAPLRSEGWLRSDDPVFLAWSKHWYDEVCPVIAKHQITRKPPGSPGVILVQVENEYDYAHFSDEVKINYVKALAEDALADGIDVPLITCWTHQVRGSTDPVLRQIFDCCNFYPRWNVAGELAPNIAELRREQPDAPLATTELQGGWFAQVGGMLSQDQDGVTASQINNLTLFAIQNGETFMNYYMLFGGSNLGDWAARDLTTTYDYNAPIREWGAVGDRYQRVWAIGHMLQQYGARLARSVPVDCTATTSQPDVTVAERRAPDGGRYLFIRTGQHNEPREGTATVRETTGDASDIVFNYSLEPFGSKILYLPPGATNAVQGEWLPKPAPAIAPPAGLPEGVTIVSASSMVDPGPVHWRRLAPGETLAQAGDYGSQFVFYHAAIRSHSATNLMVEYPQGDAVLATINGRPEATAGGSAGRSVFALAAGLSQIELLYENRGFANGGADMERPAGISTARFVPTPNVAGAPVGGWRMQLVDGTGKRPEVRPDFDDSGWTPVAADSLEANQLTPNQTAVFRARIEVTADDLNHGKWDLNFGRIDDTGWVYVNGKSVGHTTDWSLPYSFDVTKELHPGANVVAVVVRNDSGGGGIGAPTFGRDLSGVSASLPAFGYPAGVEQGWWRPEFDDQGWQPVAIGSGAPPSGGLLRWYRMTFQLPPARSGVRVPWRLRLDATGNGFLYLNGHAIGRYWQVGPQHDFFLPECWLNVGARTNVIALSLRPLDRNAAIQTAIVEPYPPAEAGIAVSSARRNDLFNRIFSVTRWTGFLLTFKNKRLI
ncbi:MAG TPA: beta-galactosidase [Verrucomicrobiae bacterium]|nr:beta-galactosidase [Verrucomicrobiae bacterium]